MSSFCSDIEILTYLKTLRIISKILADGRLSIIDGNLFIYDYNLVNWCKRKLLNDGKTETVVYLQKFYLNLNSFTNRLVIEIGIDLSNSNREKKKVLLRSIIRKLKESVNGLNNLIKTYILYPEIVSGLELIVQDIVQPQYQRLSHFLPQKNKMKRRKSF